MRRWSTPRCVFPQCFTVAFIQKLQVILEHYRVKHGKIFAERAASDLIMSWQKLSVQMLYFTNPLNTFQRLTTPKATLVGLRFRSWRF